MSTVQIGSTIDDRYQVTAVLGSGGMGTVYAASELLLDRDVAIKLIHKVIAPDEKSNIRFKREAEILSRLSDKNIVRLFRYGVWNGMPYLVMEKLPGRSLHEILRAESTLAPRRALSIAIQIAGGLVQIHAVNIVHRDLKPENLFITDDDVVKLLDFGLCKTSPEGSQEVQKLTESGFLIGSIHYMSPEMCVGQPADAQSDIYALGIIFFEMLNGAPPFDSDNPVGLLYKHMNDPVPLLREKYPLLPCAAEIDSIIQKCLAKKKSDRFASVDQLLNALNELYQEMPASEALKPQASQALNKELSRKFRLPVALALIVLSACAAIVLCNGSVLAAILCLPTYFMSYKQGLQYEIQVARTLETTALSNYASSVWLAAEARAGQVDDRLMLANITLKLAAHELTVDKKSAARKAVHALQLMSKPLCLPVPKDSEARQVYKENIAMASNLLSLAGAEWTRHLNEIADTFNAVSGPLYVYPEAILPLNLLKRDIGPQDDGSMGWTLLRLGNTYEFVGKLDEAVKCSKEAVKRFHAGKDQAEAFSARTYAVHCLERQRHAPSQAHYSEGIYAFSLARRLFEKQKTDSDLQLKSDAFREMFLLDVTEGYLRIENGDAAGAKKIAEKAGREAIPLEKEKPVWISLAQGQKDLKELQLKIQQPSGNNRH